MKKWEYLLGTYSMRDFKITMNDFGKDGWEIISFEANWLHSRGPECEVLFKRESERKGTIKGG